MLNKKRQDVRLLFVNCCLRKNAPTKVLPVGLGYVMTYLHQHGYRFDLLDIDINEYDDAYVESYIKDCTYDAILLGAIVTHYKWVKWFVKMVKQHHPATKVLVGNSVGGSIHDVFLTHVPADAVVIGEGEFSALDTLDAWRAGADLDRVEGIAFRAADGRIVKTPKRKACDINTLPMINWEFFEVDRYIKQSAHYLSRGVDGDEPPAIAMPVSTARGCAFRCTFCHFVFWDDPYRHRSSESILAEIRRNMEQFGATYISFWDDLSFGSLRQVETLCDAILDSGLKFDWMAAIRCDLFGKATKIPYERRIRVAEKMKRAGCRSVGFALESGNAEILKMMNKLIEPEYFFEQVQILRKVGIVCNTSVVFGYPIETPETVAETFAMCLKVGVYPSIGFLLPLPYTGMYEYAKQHGFITDEDAFLESITERQDICVNMTTMSDTEIMEHIKIGARKLNELLELGLGDDHLIKTGGAKKQTNLKKLRQMQVVDPDAMKRNEGDVNFNYSGATFQVDSGVGAPREVASALREVAP